MEVVVNTHGKGLPATKVFADEAGLKFLGNAFGENEAALLMPSGPFQRS